MHRSAIFLLSAALLLLTTIVDVSSSSVIAITELYDNTYANDDWDRRQELARSAIEAELINAGYSFEFRPHPNVSSNDDAYSIMKADADSGTRLVIIHNTKFVNATAQIAQEYPEMLFFTTPSVGSFGNRTYQMYGYLYQATWLGGIACGLMTKTNKVGVLSMSTKKGQVAYSNSFLLGVKHVNPNAEVYIVKTDAVADPIQEKKGAEILAKDHGTDCHLGGTLSAGFKVWSDLGLYSIGGGGGFDRFAGTDNTLFGTYYDFTSLYRKALFSFANGTYPIGQVDWGSLGDVVTVGAFSPIIPPTIKRRLDDEYNRVLNGSEKIFCGSRLSPPRANESDCMTPFETRTMPQWLPAFINPRNVTYNDSVEYIIIDYDHPLGVSIILLSMAAIAMCILFGVLVIYYRDMRNVKIRSPVFLLLILFGCIVMLASAPTFFGKPTAATCQLRHWLFCIGYAIAVGAMVSKNVRIWRLFKNPSMKIMAITNTQLMVYGVAPSVSVMAVIMIVWSAATPYVPVIGRFQTDLDIEQFNIRCLSSSSGPAIAALVFALALLIFGYFIAYQVKDVGKYAADADESKQMGYILSIIFIFGIALLLAQLVTSFTALSELVIHCIVIFICPTFIAIFLFLPVVSKWKNGTLDVQSSESGTTSSSHGMTTYTSGSHVKSPSTAK